MVNECAGAIRVTFANHVTESQTPDTVPGGVRFDAYLAKFWNEFRPLVSLTVKNSVALLRKKIN